MFTPRSFKPRPGLTKREAYYLLSSGLAHLGIAIAGAVYLYQFIAA